MLILDLNGTVIEVNNAILRYGYKKEDIIGKSVFDLVSRKYHPLLMKDFSQASQGEPAKNVIEIETPNGKLTAEYSGNVLMKEENVVGVQVIIRGLNERKHFEKAILESQQKFRGLFMGNPEAAAYLGSDCRVLDINPRFEMLFGYSLEEIKGKHVNDAIVPKSLVDEAESLDKRALDGYVYYNTERRRKDGSLVPVAVSAAPILVEDKPSGIVVMYKDISDLKMAERKLETMNEKLQVVGGLTRHDVRNKLSVISGNAYLLKKQLAGDNGVQEKLKDMETAVQQVTRIFEFAKAYESLGVEELIYVDLGKTVDEAVGLFQNLKDVRLANKCHGLTILADSLLRQMFYNLIENSLKHGQKTSKIEVNYEKASQDELRVYYEDDGVGIPETVKLCLFKEGSTAGKGIGYGLFLIKKMTEAYGWGLQETGLPDKGVRFVITIPKLNKQGKENFVVS
jgi:PAS domain S-box-containing protein